MKIKICVEPGCKNAQTTRDFCRLHYLKNWKAIRDKVQKKAAAQLNKYIDGICKKHPDRFMDVIRRDIRNGRGDFQTSVDEAMSGGTDHGPFDDPGVEDDDSLDKLLSHIKLDKDY